MFVFFQVKSSKILKRLNAVSSKQQSSRYCCVDALTTWTLTKGMEIELDGNYSRLLRAIVNMSWRQPPPQGSSCTATYHPSRKISKLDEPDMQDTAGEVETNSSVTYSSGSLHIDELKHDDQLELTYSSSVLIQDVTLKTYRKRWTIERSGGRGSGISLLMASHDDDDFNTQEKFACDCF